jgi:pyruvate dehydrogenase E2 component (dihydrolipoamide acetyltransferase)
MSDKKLFLLPDLGEGLPDAEIVEWHVKVGDVIRLDEPLISMETAKAVVDVPSPFSGKVLRLAGDAGDVIVTGTWLAEFELDPNLPQRAEAQDTGHHHGGGHAAPPSDVGVAGTSSRLQVATAPTTTADVATRVAPTETKPADAGTVVGAMQTSDAIRSEQAVAIGGVKAMPAVRALAKKLGVDLARVRPTGADGVVTLGDVKQAAASGTARAGTSPAAAPAPAAYAAPARAAPPPRDDVKFDSDEPVRGVRRNMARSMSAAHAEVVPTTLMDDADLHAWAPGEDIMARTIRALAVASQTEPAMNSWYNGKEGTLRRHARVDVGIAVDSPDGLFVPALRSCERLDARQVRSELNRLRDGVKTRSLAPEELTGYTLMLSNFGVFAGKYATPVVVPPCVCIVGAGRLHHAVVPVLGGLETHRIMPLSLTFDHRAATGGEAARFLRAMIDDLQRAR